MKRFLLIALLIPGCMLQFACQQMQQKQKPEQTSEEAAAEIPPPLYLGSVHQVFSNDKFALLRIIGPMPQEGTVLITHPADGSATRMANLIVSSAQHARNNIIAADIRAGVVAKGDRVFKYRSIATPVEPDEPEPEPATLSGEEIDLGYTPDSMKEYVKRTTNAANTTQPQPEDETATEDEPEPEPAPPAPAPDMPTERGLPNFDDIPDTIGGWDSM